MNIFLDSHRLVLQKLITKKVDFLLIGGYAVNFHGYNRLTSDMDVWIKPDNDNKLLLLEVLSELGYDEDGIGMINKWNFKLPQLFSILEKPYQIEFMTHISGIKYGEARSAAIEADIDGLTFPVIHVNSLIKNKKASGRTKDLADAEYLEKILSLRKEK